MADTVRGVYKRGKKGGVLRAFERSLMASDRDVYVPPKLAADLGLVDGACVVGVAKPGRPNDCLASVETICGESPERFRARPTFSDLTAIDPHERFDLAASGDTSMRVVDLVAPIGKGTRGLIVSPPKAGKTTLLETIAKSIRAASPETRMMVLLIDERPEEVTHFRRSIDCEVLASSNDQSVGEHVELAELTLAHARCELECGHDVVLVVDSLTRMGRAFNLRGSGGGRTMSGGLDAGALEIPRRFFGLARTIEGGGSVTIVASALVDTGSRMDQLIFEEFKGTGNSELILDRPMAEQRIFPAINLPESGTRKEHHLYGPEDTARVHKLRRALSDRGPKEAMLALLKLLEKHKTNAEFLQTIPV